MTRLTIKRADGIVIGAIVVNGIVHLYDSKVATDTERDDMEHAKNDISDSPAYIKNVARWLSGKGYTVEVRR